MSIFDKDLSHNKEKTELFTDYIKFVSKLAEETAANDMEKNLFKRLGTRIALNMYLRNKIDRDIENTITYKLNNLLYKSIIG